MPDSVQGISVATQDWRQLSGDRRRALLELRLEPTDVPPLEVLQQLVTLVGDVLGAKVAVAGKRHGGWVVAAESIVEPSVPMPAAGERSAFDRLAAAPECRVEHWRTGDRDWTLVELSKEPATPSVLILQGDWSSSAVTLRQMARHLTASVGGAQTASVGLELIARHLTRALADTSGLAAVGESILDHVVQAVPSRMASLAVATPEGELSIVATHGYARVLVEHLRIASGSGIIGGVHQSRVPVLVSDTRTAPGLGRQRSRYRTDSFLAVPIVAGSEALGVVALTDRQAEGPYTKADAAAVAVLMAPAALALGRERVWREAQAYAQAAAVDPVSGLFNRRFFEARLDEELQRAIRQSTSVALLMVDLDWFKTINDRFGHIAGDTVIRDISEILKRSVRIFDVCTRYGGEEFAVMMPGGTPESAEAIAERIRQRVEAYRRSEPALAALHVTASIGVAVSPPGTSARDLVERADRALYHSKGTGKNRVSTAGPDGTVCAAG